jgi:hypothetical protein
MSSKSFVLYGCETWSVILREEHRLRVFENGVLRRIFGPKREEVAGGCRRLHNEELHNLYATPNIIRVIKSGRVRWVKHIARLGEKGNVYKILVGRPGGKTPLGIPKRRWEDNIRIGKGKFIPVLNEASRHEGVLGEWMYSSTHS